VFKYFSHLVDVQSVKKSNEYSQQVDFTDDNKKIIYPIQYQCNLLESAT